jgi:hypothetical protein
MFIYSLPLFFTYTSFGSPFELLAILLVLFAALFISAPYPDEIFEERPFSHSLYLYYYFLHAWAGQLNLWRVFWPFFIVLNLGIFITDYQAKAAEISVSSWDDLHFMFFFPSIFWTISVWRSSANTSKKIWAAYARLITLTVFLEYGLKIFIRSVYPNIFFECQEKMMDYMSCF